MKKLFIAILALGLVFVFTQCGQNVEDTRTLITKKIQYDVPIVNTDPNYDWWIGNIEGSSREGLLENIFEKALSGEVKAYNYFNEPLSVTQLKSMMADTMIQTLQRTFEPYTEYDTMIIQKIEPSDMNMIRFLEEWKYDESNLIIDKKVIAICPVMEVMVGENKLKRPLFWIHFDEIN